MTITATLPAGAKTTTVTIDPAAKFSLKGTNIELSVLANGAHVTPTVNPAGWAGALTVRGAGYVAFAPISLSDGIAFHQGGGQGVNTAFVNFSGTALGPVFNNSSEITFLLKSAYSYTERLALPSSNMRSAFEVFDNTGSWYGFNTYTTSTRQLQFAFSARGYSATYTVPAGQEDVVFGKDVVANIRIKWTNTSFSLYVNGSLVQTANVAPKVPSWTSLSTFTIGARNSRISGGGLYSSDDAIADFVIR